MIASAAPSQPATSSRAASFIAGATASTYTLGDADVGTQISVEVRYTDGMDGKTYQAGAPSAYNVTVHMPYTEASDIHGTHLKNAKVKA